LLYQKRSVNLCLVAVAVQFTLGLLTLLYKVSITLAALHQVGGFLLFTSVISALYFFSKPNLETNGNNPM